MKSTTNIVEVINEKSDGFGSITGQARPLINPGEYDCAFKYYETVKLFAGRAPKIVLWFDVLTLGKAYGKTIPRYYNAKIKGKPARSGLFSVGWNSSFMREYCGMFGMPTRLDRIPMSIFKKHIIRVKIKTVNWGYEGRKIPKVLTYSVIEQLLGVKEL